MEYKIYFSLFKAFDRKSKKKLINLTFKSPLYAPSANKLLNLSTENQNT